ncbi:MAG: peptidase M15 [Betaproteobacteria bacterium]|nr:peptidase M15 [Betaproteobacteria bacterium]
MRLTDHFHLAHLTASETAERKGIANSPLPEHVDNLRRLAAGLEQVQALLGHPLEISSGYRCAELNRAVGGTDASQHTLGMAADFTCPQFGSPVEIVAAIQASDIPFDQCILEFGRWVHISFSSSPRGRVLSIHDSGEGYLDGLRDADGNVLA